MQNDNKPQVNVDEVEASAGSKEGVVRWVLIGGLLLAVLFMSLVWIIPALMQDGEGSGDVSGQIQSGESRTDTDSIVGVEPMDAETDSETAGADGEVRTEDGLSVVEN
ncbi:hypothetical protein [Qipengyuania sp.]|uniref:hypothetical protein n=1 Tax=Qipengyuania sp. TaxID=2004515 RepID=UPI0037359D83